MAGEAPHTEGYIYYSRHALEITRKLCIQTFMPDILVDIANIKSGTPFRGTESNRLTIASMKEVVETFLPTEEDDIGEVTIIDENGKLLPFYKVLFNFIAVQKAVRVTPEFMGLLESEGFYQGLRECFGDNDFAKNLFTLGLFAKVHILGKTLPYAAAMIVGRGVGERLKATRFALKYATGLGRAGKMAKWMVFAGAGTGAGSLGFMGWKWEQFRSAQDAITNSQGEVSETENLSVEAVMFTARTSKAMMDSYLADIKQDEEKKRLTKDPEELKKLNEHIAYRTSQYNDNKKQWETACKDPRLKDFASCKVIEILPR